MDTGKGPGSEVPRGDTRRVLLDVRRLKYLREARGVRRLVCRDSRLTEGATISKTLFFLQSRLAL